MIKNKKRFIYWLVLLIIISAVIFWYRKSHQSKIEYSTYQVEKMDLTQTVSLTGKLNSDHKVNLSFRTTGVLKDLRVDTGDEVTKGQLLAVIDPGSLLSQKKEAESQLKYEKEMLENMKDNKATYSGEERDAQRAKIKGAEASIAAIDDQLKDIYLRAPIDGVVIKRTANVGETVVLSINSPVITIAKKDDLIIESNVPESDITKIKLGQDCAITFDALTPEEIFPGTIYEIDPASTLIQDVVYYRIKIHLKEPDSRLKDGMSANIDVVTNRKSQVMAVPYRGIKNEGAGKYVEILTSNGAVERRLVQTGLSGDDSLVEITQGLEGGELVITFAKNN